jgi:hypothetical protein
MDLILFLEPLAYSFQCRHPRLEQVAILEQDPVPFLLAQIDHLGCKLLLPLAQTLVLESVVEVHLMSELDDLLSRVCSLTQDEDDWCLIIGVNE